MARNIAVGDKLFVLGPFKSGKTTWEMWLASHFPAVLFYDPLGKVQVGDVVSDLDELAEAMVNPGRYTYHPPDPPKYAPDFEGWCRLAQSCEGWLLVVDEISIACDDRTPPPAMVKLWRTAHKAQNTMAICTHRAVEMPVIFRYVDHWVTFGTNVRRDLDLLGEVDDRMPALVGQLDPYEYVHLALGSAPVICEPVPEYQRLPQEHLRPVEPDEFDLDDALEQL